MKTIEERALEWSQTRSYNKCYQVITYEEYVKGATDQLDIDIQRACDILRKTGYFKNNEGISEAAMEELFIQCMKGE